jgi:iron(II)-dependent oxidoreductase
MPVEALQQRPHENLAVHLAHARARSDELFRLVRPSAMYERPIPERHRIIFYLGHLEAFDWNLIARDLNQLQPFNAEFDHLFAFGIDPTNGSLPDDRPRDWPRETEVAQYNRRVREVIDRCLAERPGEQTLQRFLVAIEHRLMHAETLSYMLHWLPFDQKMPQPIPVVDAHSHHKPRGIEIPAGEATLGLHDSFSFGWDNEFNAHTVRVPAFTIDAFSVTNGQFLEFVQAGGYQAPELWSEEGWRWITSAGAQHPKFWKKTGAVWLYRTMFAEIPLPLAWPVYVSHAEAQAYARWAGKVLPTEAQFHRAAYGSPDGAERFYPWGDAPPDRSRGNFDFASWTPASVGAFPRGNSAFGVSDLVGNGYEWTSTLFEPFPGFEPFSFYPGYSANFFDGGHYVLKGGSPRTAAMLLRRSLRNWFQPLYPYIYAKFRCVEN